MYIPPPHTLYFYYVSIYPTHVTNEGYLILSAPHRQCWSSVLTRCLWVLVVTEWLCLGFEERSEGCYG